jgi:hypothetical protein
MDYSVKKKLFTIPQESQVTCWAACAVMLKSYQMGKLLLEDKVLTGSFLDKFKNKAILPFSEVTNFYQDSMSFRPEVWQAGSAFSVERWKNLLQTYGPLIVSAPVMGTNSTHVRIMYGLWGSGNDNDTTQFKIFDPASIDNGFTYDLRIFYSHLNYQLDTALVRQNNHAVIWHLLN